MQQKLFFPSVNSQTLNQAIDAQCSLDELKKYITQGMRSDIETWGFAKISKIYSDAQLRELGEFEKKHFGTSELFKMVSLNQLNSGDPISRVHFSDKVNELPEILDEYGYYNLGMNRTIHTRPC